MKKANDNNPEKILVFLPNWVGDAVMATPALHALREYFSSSEITYLGRPAALATLEGLKLADSGIVDFTRAQPGFSSTVRLLRQIRKEYFDLAILFPNSFRTAMFSKLAGVKRIAGYDRDGRGWLMKYKVQPPRDASGNLQPISAIDYYNELARKLGAHVNSRKMTLAVSQEAEAHADGLLAQAQIDKTKPIVILNPGASFGVSKIWDSDRYAALADKLIERRGAQIIINAAPDEKHVAAHVEKMMKNTPAINFANHENTLTLLKSMTKRCDLLITNDTGARHFAAAFSIGVVTIFGSTDPRWAQIDYDLERIVRVDVPCSPCQKKYCLQPPGPQYHRCMDAITPDMVLAPAEELLDLLTSQKGSRGIK